MRSDMKIRKIAAIAFLVFSSFAANNVAPSKAELEAMYDKAFREFDANNFAEALKQLDAIDARQPDLAESQNLRGVILMRQEYLRQGRGSVAQGAATLIRSFGMRASTWRRFRFCKKTGLKPEIDFEKLLSANASELQGEASSADSVQNPTDLSARREGQHGRFDPCRNSSLSPETPAVQYANAAIALQHKNLKEAKDLDDRRGEEFFARAE